MFLSSLPIMSVLFKFLCHGGLLFLCLIVTGIYGAEESCSAKDISVEQMKIGGINGKQEFKVTLFNGCECPQMNVKLDCKQFKSALKIDPKVLVVKDGVCSLPVGSSIPPFSGYVFNYAWNFQFPFNKPFFSEVQC